MRVRPSGFAYFQTWRLPFTTATTSTSKLCGSVTTPCPARKRSCGRKLKRSMSPPRRVSVMASWTVFGSTGLRSEEHTSELQSLMRISSAVFCLKKKKKHIQNVLKYTIQQQHPQNGIK